MGLYRTLADIGTLVTLETMVISNTLAHTSMGKDIIQTLMPNSGAMYASPSTASQDANGYIGFVVGTIGALIAYAIVDYIADRIERRFAPNYSKRYTRFDPSTHDNGKPNKNTVKISPNLMHHDDIREIIEDYKEKNK